MPIMQRLRSVFGRRNDRRHDVVVDATHRRHAHHAHRYQSRNPKVAMLKGDLIPRGAHVTTRHAVTKREKRHRHHGHGLFSGHRHLFRHRGHQRDVVAV
jgi:hypothetical protein